MVEGVRCLIIKCSKSSTNSVANACNSEQLILVVQDLGGAGGGNSKCQNTTLSFQPPPDLYALPADKTATQHIAKSHHSWQHPSENILPNIYCQILPVVGIYCHSPTRIFSQTAKPTRAIIPFVQACPVNAPYHDLPFAVYLTISF